jgi:uncharacterized membrane protein YedE/YeeE
MFETLGLEMTPRMASIWFGVLVGLAFGALAQVTRFCLRRALVGPDRERAEARGVWALALAVAMIGTQGAVALGLVSFEAHRFHVGAVPVLALVAGGLMFGLGTVLARGCLSRLTVLGASGNLRALVAVLVAAVAAQATLQGALAPLRTTLTSVTVPLEALPGAAWIWGGAIAALALLIVLRSRVPPALMAGGAAIGALVTVGWVGTGFVLQDEFDPIALEGVAFTGPWAEALFWGVAAQVTNAGFGAGLIGGVLGGAFLAAAGSRGFRLEGFESVGQMGRSLGGAVLMGVGGVLAGGCTVGAGLAGLPTLGLAALIAFASIVAGIYGAHSVLAGRTGTRGLVPAE